MHDTLPRKGYVQSHATSSNFGKISDNIFKTVKDMHSCNGRLIEYRMQSIEWHHCQCLE